MPNLLPKSVRISCMGATQGLIIPFITKRTSKTTEMRKVESTRSTAGNHPRISSCLLILRIIHITSQRSYRHMSPSWWSQLGQIGVPSSKTFINSPQRGHLIVQGRSIPVTTSEPWPISLFPLVGTSSGSLGDSTA